ncbi:MAG TPA: hypothetical protein VL357_13775 [Rariglobus sp.]|jgi:hypothetical protein|nr:hypothetical protein [Rariglobus sp.]
MRQSLSHLPIRPLVLPARLGRRQRSLAPSHVILEARARFEQSNLAVALAAGPVWLHGPLFRQSRLSLSSAAVRHAA